MKRLFVRLVRGLLPLTVAASTLGGADPAADSGAPVRTRHVYKVTEQRELALDFFLPPAHAASDSRPVVLFFFGGGFWTWNPAQFARQADYFARRGLIAVLADYRTGQKDGTRPPVAFEDARSAMRWLRMHAPSLGIDPARIAASGGSAGGSLAAALDIVDGLDAPNEERAVSVRPNALLLYNPGLSRTVNQRGLERFGGEENWRRTAAAWHAEPATPPTLLLYGSRDPLLTGGRAHADQLRALGVRADLLVTADAGHGYFNFAPHLAHTTRDVDAFLQSLGWLGDEPVVAPPDGDAALEGSPNNPERGGP